MISLKCPSLIQILPVCVLITHTFILANHDAKRLYDDLLRKNKYNKLLRPVGNASEKLLIKMGIKLTQVIDVVSMLCSYIC